MILILLPMNDCSDLWMNSDGEIEIANVNSTTQKRDAAKRKQCCASPLETLCPLWTTRTQSNLRVEELKV